MADRVFKYKPHIRLARKGELNEGLWIVRSGHNFVEIIEENKYLYVRANNFASLLNYKYRMPVAQSSSSPAYNVGMRYGSAQLARWFPVKLPLENITVLERAIGEDSPLRAVFSKNGEIVAIAPRTNNFMKRATEKLTDLFDRGIRTHDDK